MQQLRVTHLTPRVDAIIKLASLTNRKAPDSLFEHFFWNNNDLSGQQGVLKEPFLKPILIIFALMWTRAELEVQAIAKQICVITFAMSYCCPSK